MMRILRPVIFCALTVGLVLAQAMAAESPFLRKKRGNIVQLEERFGRLEVRLFLDRLFLPSSHILQDDAYAILDHVISRMKRNPDRRVVFKAIGSSTSQSAPFLTDLSTQRSTIIFSYLIHATYQ